MTVKLYDEDSHLKAFNAAVLSCERTDGGYKTVLDRTAFFPEGGGQSADTGTIDGVRVYDAQIIEGIIYHYTEGPVKTGDTVKCGIDWERRFRRMQNHSGEHIVSGIVNSLFGYENVGFHLGDAEVTMDFNGELSRDDLLRVERLANGVVYRNAAFSARYPSAEELRSMTYRSKLELTENVRIVTVEGCDACACCAPHVSSAAEIGMIKLLDFYKNRGGVRIFLKCGYDALEDYNEKYNNVLSVSNALSAKQNETAAAVERLINQMSEQKQNIASLKKRLIDVSIRAVTAGDKVTVIFEDGLDIKELQFFADGLYKRTGVISAVFSGTGDTYAFAICGAAGLESLFAGFKQSFAVRGGGRNGMVQGSVSAYRDALEEYFSKLPF